MLYEEARVYLDHVSKYGSVLGLDSIKSLLGELGNPQKDLKFIHIAGTNGKGSILAGLSGILQQAGYRTGRYCSPTVMGYMERFQVDGQWMAEDELAPFVSQVKEAAEKAKKTTKHTLYLTQELTENTQRSINKAQKVMTIHIINNVRVPYI